MVGLYKKQRVVETREIIGKDESRDDLEYRFEAEVNGIWSRLGIGKRGPRERELDESCFERAVHMEEEKNV